MVITVVPVDPSSELIKPPTTVIPNTPHKSAAMAVTLRTLELTDADIDDAMSWLSDEKVAEFSYWEPYMNRSDVIEFIKDHVRSHPWFRAISVDGRAVGAISVTKNTLEAAQCRGEIGFVIGSGYWGKGIGTAVVKLAVERIFVERPELQRVEALVVVENLASIRVLEKAGFKREGVLRKYGVMKGRIRDFVIFSILSTDLNIQSSN